MAEIELKTEVSGSVWKIVAGVGQAVAAGDTVMIIESMKMEIPITAENSGKVSKVLVQEKAAVREGQTVAVLAPD